MRATRSANMFGNRFQQFLETILERNLGTTLHRIYDESFNGLPIQKQANAESTLLGRHLYIVRLKQDRLINNKGEIIKTLSQKGITATVHYRPRHLQPLYHRPHLNSSSH